MQFSILGLTLLGLAAASPLNYNTTLARRELGWNITITNTAIPLTRRHLENTTVASTALTNTTLTPRHLGWNVTVANTTITIPRRRRGSHTTLASNAITNTTLTPRHAGWNITVANTTITIPRRQLSSLCGSGLGVPQCCDFSLTGRANANCDPPSDAPRDSAEFEEDCNQKKGFKKAYCCTLPIAGDAHFCSSAE